MRIQTFSIVVGTRACNAHCPFCVSKMTGFSVLPKVAGINEPNLAKACRLAQLAGTTTVLLTGKGEPTLYPRQITRYLQLLQPWNFPFIELQTNGLEIGDLATGRNCRLTFEDIGTWKQLGLNTVALSTVGVNDGANAMVYRMTYPDLATTISFLHSQGFTVRLCVMMLHGDVSSPANVKELIRYCKDHGVEQLKISPIRRPESSANAEVSAFVRERGLSEEEIAAIATWLDTNGTRLLTLMHGATVYDVAGQNVCLSDCLTVGGADDDVRTLIFYADGRLAYDWQYPGAVLLGGLEPPEQAAAATEPTP
ncbi:MAG: radical SAM protein [Candidatus Aenigmarchaeota archaeon]|nr:radical SAM protein [Candidatus Aenigmarchaeota archaeon]